MSRKAETVPLDDLDPFQMEGTPEDIDLVEHGLAIMARKQLVWSSVLEGWKRNATPLTTTTTPFAYKKAQTPDETVAALVELYVSDERSPYRQIRHKTRKSYDSHLRQIKKDYGSYKLSDIKKQDIDKFWNDLTDGGKRRRSGAHARMTMLRGLFNFGVTIQKSECERLSIVMHTMTFSTKRVRGRPMTEADARAIINKAHEKGMHSIALAQAFQFGCNLRQIDAIGE